MPEHWATDDGCVHLCVAKGTLVPARSLRCGQPQASAKRRKVDPIIASKFHADTGMLSTGASERTALPPLPAQLAAMLADSGTDTDAADALEMIEAFAARAPEVLSPIQAQPVAPRASGSIVATVRAYPAQAAAARAIGVQSSFQSMRGASGLQGGLQGELQDIIQDL